jgi:hypothetical protein
MVNSLHQKEDGADDPGRNGERAEQPDKSIFHINSDKCEIKG